MVKKPGEEEEVEQKSQEPPKEPPPEAQTQTLTPEELETLKARIKAEADAEYKGIQRTISKKDARIRELEEIASRPRGGVSDTLLDFLKGEYGDNPRIAQLESELRKEKQLDYQQKLAREEYERVHRKITDAGFDPSDAMFEPVFDSWEDAKNLGVGVDIQTGEFKRTHRALDRILEEVKAKKPKSEPTDLDKAVEERARKMLEEKGLLTTETGGPSAASSRYEELRDRYNVNPDSLGASEKAEYYRLCNERGLYL